MMLRRAQARFIGIREQIFAERLRYHDSRYADLRHLHAAGAPAFHIDSHADDTPMKSRQPIRLTMRDDAGFRAD